MRQVSQISFQTVGTYETVCLSITKEQAKCLYGTVALEVFATKADANFWLICNRKPGAALALAAIGPDFYLIGYAIR